MNDVVALRFGAFTLDLSRHVLLRGSEEVALRPQSFRVLACLAQRSGELIANAELIEACWDNPRHTNTNSLAQCIRDIRDALGQNDKQIIRTVPRRGYVFAERVFPIAALAAQPPVDEGNQIPRRQSPLVETLRARWLAPTALIGMAIVAACSLIWFWPTRPTELTMMAVPSIAILPFAVSGEQSDKTHAGTAFADDVATELTRMPQNYTMRIRSASGYTVQTTDHLTKTARNLGVRYVVQGSLQREGDTQLFNIQLIEAARSRAVWADFFSAPSNSQEALSGLARRIARALSAQVLEAEIRLPLPANPEPGHFVMLGLRPKAGEFGIEANRQAAARYAEAIALDPNYVPALLGYAKAKVNEVLNSWTPKDSWNAALDEAERAIMHAASIEPRNALVHHTRGTYLRARANNPEAVAAFQHALTLKPHFPFAHAELGRAKIEVGLASETVGHIEEAIRLSPADPFIFTWYFWAGMAEIHVERYASAIEWLLRARQASRAFDITLFYLAIAYAGLGQSDQARAYLDEYRALRPSFSVSGLSNVFFPGRSPIVTEQRARIVALLCQLNAPGCAEKGSKL